MRRRRLGRTGYEISEIGFGGWGIGRSEWLDGDDDEARRALACALDSGVDFLDTAAAYGDGHSERLIAEVLQAHGAADRVVVATKIPPRNMIWPGDAASPLAETFPAEHVRAHVETSLRDLRAEALQLEQLHVWHDAWLAAPGWAETRAAMEDLRRQGKVLHWGISVNDHAPETVLQAAADPLIETLQVIYNIYDQRPAAALFARARERDLGIIVRCPLDEGALAGTVGPGSAFPRGDFRAFYFRGKRKAQAAERARRLQRLLGEEAATLPELALRFCLAAPEASTVIPGMRRAAHVRANAAVSDGRALSPGLLHRLRDEAWEKDWYA